MKLIEDEETPIAYIENLEREVTRLNKEILALQAHINVLREALEEISSYQVDEVVDAVCDEALASTPAQSLQAHDDEVIVRCAKHMLTLSVH